jgi:hypothetical protein
MIDNEHWSATFRMVKGGVRSRARDFERYNKLGNEYWIATFQMVKAEARSRARDFEKYNKFGICTGTLMDGSQWCLFL